MTPWNCLQINVRNESSIKLENLSLAWFQSNSDWYKSYEMSCCDYISQFFDPQPFLLPFYPCFTPKYQMFTFRPAVLSSWYISRYRFLALDEWIGASVHCREKLFAQSRSCSHGRLTLIDSIRPLHNNSHKQPSIGG